MLRRRLLILLIALSGWLVAGSAGAREILSLEAADGVKLFADWYPAPQPKALILLFHQAGSNRGEYATIAPRLVAEGYSALAIDQRSGGTLFGQSNETVARLGRSADYVSAEQDLEAALAWARQRAGGRPIVLCGSSYSAALVFLVAAKHRGELAGVLAFSPGEYLGSPDRVRKAAAGVGVPVFITSAKDAEEVAEARRIFVAVGSGTKTQFVPLQGGVHGASTLREDRNPRGAAENWAAVLAFLRTLH